MLAAGLGAEMPAQAEERLQLLLQQMPPGFIDWPRAAQVAWNCLSAADRIYAVTRAGDGFRGDGGEEGLGA